MRYTFIGHEGINSLNKDVIVFISTILSVVFVLDYFVESVLLSILFLT